MVEGTPFVGQSRAIKECVEDLEIAAKTDRTVLIHGETGSGKDLAALWIHQKSERRKHPFIPINCACLSDHLFEAELFGHTRGSFTGAYRDASGLLEAAGSGTVLFDEIGELPLSLQAKMLRLIDKKESRRVGDIKIRTNDARLLFATNKCLAHEVAEGRFRKDLFYRINIICIRMPALRDRKEDIPGLVHAIITRENDHSAREQDITPQALAKLMTYEYPGNVRELENVMARAMARCEKHLIEPELIQFEEKSGGSEYRTRTPQMIQAALNKCHWNKTRAAREIGLSRRHLYRLMKKNLLLDPNLRTFSF